MTCAGGSAVCTYFTKKFPSFYPVRFLGLPCPRAAQSLLVYGPHAWAACAEALSFRNRTRFQTRILLDFEVPVFLKAAMLFGFSNEKEFLPDNGLPTDVFWLCPYSVVHARREFPRIRFQVRPFPTHEPIRRQRLESRAYDLFYSWSKRSYDLFHQKLLNPPADFEPDAPEVPEGMEPLQDRGTIDRFEQVLEVCSHDDPGAWSRAGAACGHRRLDLCTVDEYERAHANGMPPPRRGVLAYTATPEECSLGSTCCCKLQAYLGQRRHQLLATLIKDVGRIGITAVAGNPQKGRSTLRSSATTTAPRSLVGSSTSKEALT